MASEPQLKFRRLESDVDSILRQEEASCFCVAEKLLALGTRTGTVYLLSCCGDQVLVYRTYPCSRLVPRLVCSMLMELQSRMSVSMKEWKLLEAVQKMGPLW